MRGTLLGLVAIASASACGTSAPSPTTRTEAGDLALPKMSLPSATELSAAYNGTVVDVNRRVTVLDLYVRGIEVRLRSPAAAVGANTLLRTSTNLRPGTFSDISDIPWGRIEAFYDGKELVRLRILPTPGPFTRSEEFYYSKGRLVYVYVEPDGARKRDPHVETTGDGYYFGSNGMIAWVFPDGRMADPKSSEFKAWAIQLEREGDRFPREAKAP